ncbi:ribokinase [soil metagenome]
MSTLVKISAIGIASLDIIFEVDSYPHETGYAIVRNSVQLPGGTTANSAVAAHRLGADVALTTVIGRGAEGDTLANMLEFEGLSMKSVSRDPIRETDVTTLIVSRASHDTTIFWKQGARPQRGMKIDVDTLFGADTCLIDVDDLDLYRFLVDLPVHTRPGATLLGTLTYLDRDSVLTEEILARVDAVVGSSRDARALLHACSDQDAARQFQHLMVGSNLRLAVITAGEDGALGITRDQIWHAHAAKVSPVDTTGAGDAFAGAMAIMLAMRSPIDESLRFSSVVAGLATAAIGAQTALPTEQMVHEFMRRSPPAVERMS